MGNELAIIALVVLLLLGVRRDFKFTKKMNECNEKICKVTKDVV